MRSGGGRVQLRLLVTLVLASWCMALAQPLAAAGGWARPVEVPTERPAAAVDRLDEVIPDAEQTAGAAFGFQAPGARAPQAVLIAVPPDPEAGLDAATVAQIVCDTRELAHLRMARPVDLGESPNAVFGTALLPATGPAAVHLGAQP